MRRIAMLSVHTSPLAQPGAGDGGGLNVSVAATARELARRGVHVDVFTRSDADQPDTIEVVPGLLVHHLQAGEPGPIDKGDITSHLCEFLLNVERHPTAGSHDLLHGHYWLSGWVARRLSARYDVPFVQTFHTYGVLKNAALAPGDEPEPILRLVAEQRIARDADQVLGLTCAEAALLHRQFGVSGARISIVPAGVDNDLFRPEPGAPEAEATAATLVGDAPGPVLLFAGRLQPLKAPDVAIATLAAVRERHPTARLVVVGEVSGSGVGRTSPDQLRALAADLGVADAVGFVGAVPQDVLAALYRRADVVVVPSRTETFGLVAIEAQACGAPVVAASAGGLRAAVREGGILVDGHDPHDHAAAVDRLLSDPARHASVRANAIAAGREAGWDRAVDGLERVYEQVLANRSLRRSA